MRAYDPRDPLPSGTTVLEASAGTGKTYTIAALAVRFLAEGRATVDQLLLVTFSRAATAELRSRVRDRVRSSASALAEAVAGTEPTDEVDRLLATCTPDELRRRAARLEAAFTSFDRATIMTTHEFCHGMITGLGVLAAQEPQSMLVEDLRPLADEVAADVYVRRYASRAARPPFGWLDETRSDPGGRSIGRDAVEVVGDLVPRDAGGLAGERVAFAAEVRAEVERRKRQRRLFSFDDQLGRLAGALAHPVTGDLACRRLAERYPVVLVDEFQDTDPVQWRILRSAFSSGTLILIGDPKQAIYAFRGADVHTYTAAVRAAQQATTLVTNHRSDASVVAAVGALFAGLELGEGIGVPDVRAARPGSRLTARAGTPFARGLQVRCVDAEKPIPPWLAGDRIRDDLVAVVAGLLHPDAALSRPDGPLSPSDLAILVRSNARGTALATALSRHGIPATFSGTTSVLASQAASDWLTLLAALDQTRRPYVPRAVLTDFVGGSVEALATASDADWATWSLWLHGWARILRRSGVPALMAALDRDTDFTARLLARVHGERDVTDHRHIAELLHDRAASGHPTIRDLADWLRTAVADAASAERTRRLETDADAVQIMTVHRAKGLQFPVVLLPEAMSHHAPDDDEGHRLVLPADDGRDVDIGGRGSPGRAERWRQYQRDESDEELRTLYVGLTRAQSHAIVWWANQWGVAGSPLHRVLFARHDPEAPARPNAAYAPTSPLTLSWLAGAGIAAVAVPDEAPVPVPPATPAPGPLHARPWHRVIDHTWRRTSYSGLTARAHELTHEAGFVDDEAPSEVDADADAALAAPSPMASLPSGPAFGTLVHAIYERLDASAPDWRARLEAEAAAALRAWPLAGVAAPELAAALAPSLTTPLGPLAEGTTLRSFGARDRLTELDFEFALDAPRATLADVAETLRPHVAGTPLGAYPDRLSGPALTGQPLHGFLTGSIDAVLRLPSGAHLVVDYKTNRLGSAALPPEALTIGHYTPPILAEAMMASHYPLQALLYSVALHRFLDMRLRGYDPDRHLGGIAYLFVRGMNGPATPTVDDHPLGVFSWRPPVALVASLSDLLAGGSR